MQLPRVAPAAQPGALRLNAFGVTRTLDGSRLPSYLWGDPNYLYGTFRTAARQEAMAKLAYAGILLERQAAIHGMLPGTLDTVAEQAGKEAVIDPFSGERFSYARHGENFLLYSIGQDMENDGGHSDLREGDIVWRAFFPE